jgi:hypothetical protein
VFFLHGERDRLLRPSGTLRIAANATVSKRIWLIPDTGHAPESLETNDREYAGQLTAFFREAFAGSVEEPEVELTVTRQHPDVKGLAIQATISTDVARVQRPMMLTLVDVRGRRRFVPFWIEDQRRSTRDSETDPSMRLRFRTTTSQQPTSAGSQIFLLIPGHWQRITGMLPGC